MADAKIKFLNSENLPAFGEVLHRSFLKDFNELYDVSKDYQLPDTWNKVKAAIDAIYQKAGLLPYDQLSEGFSNNIRIGDIIVLDNGRIYSVTGISNDNIRTFPRPITEDRNSLKPSVVGGRQGRIKRPNLSSINSEAYEKIVTEIIPEEILSKGQPKNSASFKAVTLPDDSTHIQIGDLIMGIDPIQMSFTTQNGYQYYPTLRTNGNPKLPTMQQIKNINIVLMFPNVDAINYQLIPLYAMFRRTPFVNIKNRDLLRFFHDVATPNGYIPVALESIQVQSVEGFPNSLQASITVLPFEPGPASNRVLKALRTFDDVFIQQESQGRDIILQKMIDAADLKMQDKSSLPTTFDSLTNVVSEGTENFRESFPFRAFYQSLIAERKSVLNEDGSEARLYNADDSANLLAKDISFLAPRERKNFLHHYDISANRGAIGLKYTYVTLFEDGREITNLADIGKYVSDERIDDRDARLDQFQKLFDAVGSWEGLANVTFSSFHNMSDAFRPLEYEYSKIDNLVNPLLAYRGIDPKMVVKGTPSVGPGYLANLGKLISVVLRSVAQATGVSSLTGAVQALSENSEQIGGADYNKTASDQLALLGKGGLLYNEANTGELSQFGIHTLEGAFQALWAWINEDITGARKKNFVLAVQDVIAGLKGNLSNNIIVVNASESTDGTEYAVRRLPIMPVEILIDNENDVVTSWSLVFSNKFVPINLLAYKYPFYQHVGSDDPTLSLSITSVPNDRRYDLKEELAKMSDRLYDSVKIVNYTSPNLYTWLDPRVELTYQAGHIFHCFGIEKIVVNSSNSTNIQGQPDAWNTVINLTQANFSLEQYHSISRVANLTGVDAIFAQLIPRIRIKEDGSFSVLALKHPDHIFTLDELVYISYLFSKPGQKYLEHVHQMARTYGKLEGNANITGQDLLNLIAPKFKLYSEMDPQQEDGAATQRLNVIAGENKKFKDLLTAILKEYDWLLESQTNAFINVVNENKSIFEQVWQGVKDSAVGIAGASLGAVAVDAAALFLLAAIPGINIIAGVTLAGIAIGALIYTGTNVAAEMGRNTVKEKFSGLIANLIDVYKKEMLAELSRAIIKDPPIRQRLLDPVFVSLVIPPDKEGKQVDVEKYIKNVQDQKKLNCYPDFDMPVVWERDDRVYKASPDFYLYNSSSPDTYIKTYIKESTDRLMKAGKMGIQLAMVEHQNLYKKLSDLKKEISNQGDESVQNVLSGIYDEVGYTSTADSFLNLARMYRLVVYNDENIPLNSIAAAEQKAFVIDETRKKELLDEHAKINDNLRIRDKTQFEYEQAMLSYMLDLNIAPKIQDRNLVKFNMVWTARMQTLIEILALGYQIQTYFASETALKGTITPEDPNNKKELFKYVEQEKGKQQLSGQILERISSLREVVWTILNNWKVVTTDVINGSVPQNTSASPTDDAKAKLKKLKDKFNKGMFAETVTDPKNEKESDYLQLPSIRNLESEVYNKIGYFIRLNTVIELANRGVLKPYAGTAPNISLDSLPELGFIDAFNVRTTESVFRALEIERQLSESIQKSKNNTLKFFPTFKIFFIEEDSKRYTILDDYYAYNAVQSIEIVKSKGSASVVAVIRLNNLTGTITDKLSFHRERSDFASAEDFLNDDEAFFGTLDIKPGTKVQIKLGYAANDSDLPTVFTGRILEMNVGPVTEMICQSFGAQLNHKVLKEKFGFFSSEKEYGDIASALLDMIPGLENLGKKELVTFGLLSGFTGRDLKKIRTSLFDNFLMSTALGRLTADLRGYDNPRDENIYLPFNLSLYPKWKPRFDWIVYNQSVWNSIQELCLYCNNTDAVIKQYNNDPLSQRNEQRETIVVGNKSGYYKWTNSLSLSSIDTDDINARIEEFKQLLTNTSIKNSQFTNEGKSGNLSKIKSASNTMIDFVYTNISFNILSRTDVVRSAVGGIPGGLAGAGVLATARALGLPLGASVKYANLKTEFVPIWNWLSDPLNANILKKKLIGELDISIRNVDNFASEAFKRQFKTFADPISLAIDALDTFSSSALVKDPVTNNVIVSQKGEVFPNIIFFINAIEGVEGKAEFWDLTPDEYYSVRGAIDNINPALCSDPRYKKIQQHHLISESINLISNEIALNANFPNKINLYYFDDPQFISSIDGVQPDKFNKINMWPVRAFGDIKDEHIREMNIFQKNIDPYWLDVKESTEGFYKGYRRLLTKAMDKKGKKGDNAVKDYNAYIESIGDKKFGTFNINTPDWRAFPSYQIVGVNLLKKEVAKMYRGALQIVGDTEIEPADIIHIQDYINDMHGAVEVDEIVHTFTPDRGLITTITPALITYDRDPIQLEDVSVINKIYDRAQAANVAAGFKLTAGLPAVLGGIGIGLAGNPGTGLAVSGAGIGATLSGLNHIFGNRYHRFLYDSLGNILGRDVINFTALLYHGLPFMCGFDGVDYTNLKTLITHKANDVDGTIITRMSVFSDELAAAINTNFTPGNFSFTDAILNKAGILKYTGLSNANQLQDAFSFGDRLQFWHNIPSPFGD